MIHIMAGGYWGNGNNPYWNFDSDASLRNSQMNDAYKLANNAQIDTIKAQSDASLARSKANMANIEISDLRNCKYPLLL
ncbi:hypothetical protein CTQ98_27590 [Salmonella enterica subsp. diarizonae]|nr:hypothetical protein [Salmonella enterica subsp. diarizonae]